MFCTLWIFLSKPEVLLNDLVISKPLLVLCFEIML